MDKIARGVHFKPPRRCCTMRCAKPATTNTSRYILLTAQSLCLQQQMVVQAVRMLWSAESQAHGHESACQ